MVEYIVPYMICLMRLLISQFRIDSFLAYLVTFSQLQSYIMSNKIVK